MKLKLKKRTLVLLGVMVVAIAASIGAYAYFTSTGSGTGSAAVGTSANLTIVQTNTISALTPNGPTVPIAYTISNPAVNGAQNLGVVSYTITGFSGNNNTPSACTSADFNIVAGANPVGTIAAGGTYTSTALTEPTIQMKDTGVNQDGCKNAALVLTLSAAAGS